MRFLIILFFFLPQVSFAKCFVINEVKIECVRGFTPSGSLKAVPQDENGEDVLDIKDIDIVGGEPIYSQSKRDARLALEAARQAQREADNAQLKTIEAQLKAAINTVDVSSDVQLRATVKKMLRLMLRETQ